MLNAVNLSMNYFLAPLRFRVTNDFIYKNIPSMILTLAYSDTHSHTYRNFIVIFYTANVSTAQSCSVQMGHIRNFKNCINSVTILKRELNDLNPKFGN